MEDILASIRRILSEDETADSPTAKPAEEPASEPSDEPEDDVLVLDPSMLVPEPEPAAEPEATAEPEPVIELAPVLEPPPVVVIPTQIPAQIPAPIPAAVPASMTDLVAPAAAAAAASSVDNLVRTLAAGRSTQVYAAGPTIEDLVREEVRPLLKEWLDTHLPPMVERLVRLEIERVVGRVVP